ncbi:MAG TPA: Rid family hydrolase [Planctomycetota bacterium]|nr:Rid family hydrolase [Planctomycetota bacterium]
MNTLIKMIRVGHTHLLLAGLGAALAACAGHEHAPAHDEQAVEHLPAQGAMGPYSAAVTAGDLVFFSGKIGERGGSFEREVETAIDALEAELKRLDLGLGDVTAVTVYLTDMSTFAEMNGVYGQRFPEPWPARTTVAVAGLPGGARIELSATAVRR